MTLSALGKHGLRETAVQCLSKAEYLKAGVRALKGPFSVAFPGRTFNEFAIRCGVPPGDVLKRAEAKKILAGVPYARLAPADAAHSDLLLAAVTERTPREGIDAFLDVLRSFA
jgi:glycine dehydrogenase subunit 1